MNVKTEHLKHTQKKALDVKPILIPLRIINNFSHSIPYSLPEAKHSD